MKIGIDISPAVYGTGVSDYTVNLVQNLMQTDPDNSYVLFGSSLRRVGDLAAIFPQARLFRFPPMGLHLLWNVLHTVNIEKFIGSVDVFHFLLPPIYDFDMIINFLVTYQFSLIFGTNLLLL